MSWYWARAAPHQHGAASGLNRLAIRLSSANGIGKQSARFKSLSSSSSLTGTLILILSRRSRRTSLVCVTCKILVVPIFPFATLTVCCSLFSSGLPTNSNTPHPADGASWLLFKAVQLCFVYSSPERPESATLGPESGRPPRVKEAWNCGTCCKLRRSASR